MMWKTPKSFNKINIQILTVLVLLLVVAGLIVSAFNYANVHAVYEKSYTEKVLMSNEMIASFINNEDVLYYVDLLRNQNDDFKEKQIQFSYDRDELFLLQQNKASIVEQEAVIQRMQAFYEETSVLKTPEYESILEQFQKVKETSGARYVHMFADTGLMDHEGNLLYTCIYDAEDLGSFDKIDSDFLGSTGYHELSAGEIYITKQAMTKASYYYEEPYGEMYYAYAPILDDSGDVIAIVSTEVGAEVMRARINETMIVNTTIFGVFILIAILFIYYFINQFVARPLEILTRTASTLAEGNIDVHIPKQSLKINNELGILACAIKDLSNTYQSLVNSTTAIFDAANSGKFDVRHDPDEFSGDIAILAKQINETLDVMTLFLNSVPESICIMTKQFEMLFNNHRYCELFHETDAEALVRGLLPDSANLSKEELQKQFILALELGETIDVWKNDMCFSVILTDVAEDSVMIIAIDITDLMKEKENAHAAAKAKSDFLSRMSHEMRTPMNAIIGMVKIAENTTDIEKMNHCLSTINASSNHLLSIINDVLDMSKIDAGQLQLEYESFSLEKVLAKVRDLVGDQAEQKHQKLTVRVGNDLEHDYIGDELRLSQVLTNLLSNAVKFTPDGGSIEVAVEKLRKEGRFAILLFSVKDTGIGISKEQQARLFTSFEQADGSISRRFGGTGLGLAISKSIIEKIGGRIWIESEIDKGSTFCFEVKLEEQYEHKEEPIAEDPGVPDLTGVKVLLAEDIEINREIFKALMEDTKIQIVEAFNGIEVVEKFKENMNEYDLIFMDIQMPEVDGHEATRIIRSLDDDWAKNIPIVAMTANVFKEDIDECIKSGMNDHIAKPIDEKIVYAKLRQYLKAR